MSTTASTQWQYLERDPKSSYRQLSIKGRRIRARTLYGSYMSEENPRTIEEIALGYDLPVEAVREAIAYCQADPAEIHDDFAREDALMQALGMNHPNYNSCSAPKQLSPREIAQIDGATWGYLDDDSVEALLVRLLRDAGHDTQTPAEAGLVGADDAIHLRHAIYDDRIILSRNFRDFENLHYLVLEARGRHPGILVVRKDNNPRRDMTPRGVVHAIAKMLTAGFALDNELSELNLWR